MAVYIPYATRFRPWFLEDLYGQDTTVMQVKGIFKSDRISRALLLSGPLGSGKTTLARIISFYANCMNFDSVNVKPCGTCKSCVKRRTDGKMDHPDVMEINASDNRKIDDIRGVIGMANFAPSARYRIFIMDEVHKLTEPAQNAFLKILEEPPDRTMFILCTTEPEGLLDTIRSRCQKLTIKPVPTEACVKLLQKVCLEEKIDIPVDTLERITALSHNHPRDCLQSLESVVNYFKGIGTLPAIDDIPEVVDSVLDLPQTELITKFLTAIYTGKFTSALRVVNNLNEYDYFSQNVMEYHTQAMYYIINRAKLCDEAFRRFLTFIDSMLAEDERLQTEENTVAEKENRKPKNMKKMTHFTGPAAITVTIPAMALMLGSLVKLCKDQKAFTVDGYYLLVNFAMDFVVKFKDVIIEHRGACQ